MTRTPEEIFKAFESNARNYIAAEESYKAAALTPEARDKAQVKIDSANFHLKTLKAICGAK